MIANSCHVSRGLDLARLQLAGTLELVPDEWDRDPIGWKLRQVTGSADDAVHLEHVLGLCKPECRESMRWQMGRWSKHVPTSQRVGSSIQPEYLMAPLDTITMWMMSESTCVQTAWHDQFEAEEGEEATRSRRREFSFDPDWRVYRKVDNSRWRWGCGSGWNMNARIFNALPNLRIEHPRLQFDQFLTWTVGCNERGNSVHMRWAIDGDASTHVWLDGTMGLCLWLDDVYVGTIGFAPLECGLGIMQIQFKPMDRKTRNKVLGGWDYKAAVIEAFRRAFAGVPLFMATGASLLAWNRKSFENQLANERHWAEKNRSWDSAESMGRRQQTIRALLEKIESLKDPELESRMNDRYAKVPKNRKKLWNSNGIEFVPL